MDFRKAFDSIWHEGLYYRLLQCGIWGKTFDIIKSMSSGNKCSIQIGDQHTNSSSQKSGVRQGCNWSPILFHIFINQLAETLEQSTAPGLPLHDTEIKSLFYADDLVLMSPTKEGLQQQLVLLEAYCQNWAMEVNTKKKKVIDRKSTRLNSSHL